MWKPALCALTVALTALVALPAVATAQKEPAKQDQSKQEPAKSEPDKSEPAKKDAAKREAEQGKGVPAIPDKPPADQPTLAEFLRRVLFELPPGPPEKARGGGEQPEAVVQQEDEDETPQGVERQVSLKPIPARRAKLEAVEVMRDMALEEKAFAAGILPLLDEFMVSRGVSERAACLVATTRIRHKYSELKK